MRGEPMVPCQGQASQHCGVSRHARGRKELLRDHGGDFCVVLSLVLRGQGRGLWG